MRMNDEARLEARRLIEEERIVVPMPDRGAARLDSALASTFAMRGLRSNIIMKHAKSAKKPSLASFIGSVLHARPLCAAAPGNPVWPSSARRLRRQRRRHGFVLGGSGRPRRRG